MGSDTEAMTVRLATSARNASTDAISALANAGSGPGEVRIYSGAQPATPNTAASGTLLVTVVLADPAFGGSSVGVATAPDPASVNAVATGTAGWWRLTDSAGNAVMDGAADDGSLVLATNSIVSGGPVDILSFTHATPLG